ncbi:MATE family efflux transporter [Oscillospiraceae bacterium LCP21S3_A1]
MDNSKTELFESMPIPKAVVTLSVPSVISSLVMVIYSLADTFFVGMMNDPVQNAAVTLAAPLLLAFNAVNNLFGIGSSSMMSRALGRKDYDTVYRSSAFGFYASLICSLLFSLLYGVLQSPILVMLGANAETMQATANYLFWTVLLGSAPSILNVVLAYLVRAEGSSLHASIGTMCGCLLNIVLDPIFILPWGLNLGAAGAGCATCLSNTVACLYFFVLLFVKRGKTYVCIKPSMFRPSKQIVKGVCGVGIPASIQNLLNVTGMTILNNFTSAYGSDPVAAMGIAQRVNIVPFQIAMGFSQGIMPLISYNYTSGNIKRMKKTFMFTAKISLGFILAVMLTFVFAAEPIISMFMKNESIVAYGAAFQRGFCFALPFLCIDFLVLGVFQSCGMGMKSFIFAVVRKIVLEIPALFVLNWLFPLYGLAYAQFVAELILGTIAVVVLVKMFRRLEREHAAPYVSDSESVK